MTVSISVQGNGRGRLELTNGGPAVARSVTLEITSADEAKQPPAVFGLDALPADFWPGQSMPFDLAVALGEATLLKALVRWVDDAGPQEATYTPRTL